MERQEEQEFEKKNHLEAKHKPRKEEDEIRGIPISEESLGVEVEEVQVLSYVKFCRDRRLRTF